MPRGGSSQVAPQRTSAPATGCREVGTCLGSPRKGTGGERGERSLGSPVLGAVRMRCGAHRESDQIGRMGGRCRSRISDLHSSRGGEERGGGGRDLERGEGGIQQDQRRGSGGECRVMVASSPWSTDQMDEVQASPAGV